MAFDIQSRNLTGSFELSLTLSDFGLLNRSGENATVIVQKPPVEFSDDEGFDLEQVWDWWLIQKANASGRALNGTHLGDNKEDVFQVILDYLGLYFLPMIIVVGLVGNTMSFLVFAFTHLQRLSSSFYLSSLAMADIGFLLALSIVWLERVGISLYTSDGWCQSIQYIRHVCGFLSVWTVVSFTAERYIIVYHPLQKDTFCTKTKARIVVLCLLVISLLYNTFIIVTYEAVRFPGFKDACFPLPKYFDVDTIMTSIDVIIGCVIPSVTIVLLNIKIFVKVHQYQKKTQGVASSSMALLSQDRLRRRSAIVTSVSTTGSMHIKFSSTRPHVQHAVHVQDAPEMTSQVKPSRMVRGRSHFRTARMLLVLSSVFVMLNLPSHVFRVLRSAESLFGDNSTIMPKQKMKCTELFELFYFLNFAINFFIYSACGQQFRLGLRRLYSRIHHKMSKIYQLIRSDSNEKDPRRVEFENYIVKSYAFRVK